MRISALNVLQQLNNCKFIKEISQNSLRNYSLKFSGFVQPEDSVNPKAMDNEIQNNFSWLYETVPGYPVNASKIKIIHDPSVFYSTLLEKCKAARSRITLASLYLGTGKLEKNLVDTIKHSVINSDGKVKVNILLDYMRGSRGKKNSRRMLESLLEPNCGDNCRIYLYHTPKLRGLLKRILPNRFNELIGLQHMKVYIIDNSIIISGANLSNDYFTNRQDRYFLIEDCKELCDFYNKLIQQVSKFSFQLLPGDLTSFNETESKIHPLKSPIKQFNHAVQSKINSLYSSELDKRRNETMMSENAVADTWIFPIIQMAQLGIVQDSKITLKLLKTAQPGSILRLATGYFNLTKEYSDALLHSCKATCQLLTAHPTANGFFCAKGIAGGIPAAYTSIEKSFYEKSQKLWAERITLREYVRPGWTYHAKGLWYTLPHQTKPSFTLIGSSNFGYRSARRDLETQIALVTKNDELQQRLQEEYELLYKSSHLVTKKTFLQEDRIVPAWVCATVFFFRYLF